MTCRRGSSFHTFSTNSKGKYEVKKKILFIVLLFEDFGLMPAELESHIH